MIYSYQTLSIAAGNASGEVFVGASNVYLELGLPLLRDIATELLLVALLEVLGCPESG